MVCVRRHACRWGAYAALGIALALLWQPAAADPPHKSDGAGPAGTPAQQSPQKHRAPSPSSIENAIQRVAGALEAKNGYDQSSQGQQDTHEAAKAAKEAAKWAGWMVVAAIAETLVTLAGVVLVWRTLRHVRTTADETRKQADSTAQMLELTRRPRIHVRIVAGDLSGPEFVVIVGYTNRGEETANIHRLDCGLFYRDMQTKRWRETPVWRDIQGDATTPTFVKNGEFVEQPFPFAKQTDTDWHDVVVSHRTELCLVGHVRYEDRRKITRRTGFIWAWEPRQQDFVRLDDPRWSFED